MDDVQAIYAILLAKGYQEALCTDLSGTPKKENGGRETLVSCPFCQKERHFSYNRDKPVWKCWHCSEAEDWIAYLKKAKGLDFNDAVPELAQAAGFNISCYEQARYHDYTDKADILESAQSFFIQALKEDVGRPVRDYLLKRGYSEADINAMQVGAYTDRSALQKQLKNLGFVVKRIRRFRIADGGIRRHAQPNRSVGGCRCISNGLAQIRKAAAFSALSLENKTGAPLAGGAPWASD